MSGKRSRDKGGRIERTVAAELNRHGIPATKRSGMYIAGHDLDVVVRGRPLRVEVKSREVLARSYNWLGDRDVLIVKADRREPLDLATRIPNDVVGSNPWFPGRV